MTAEDWQHNFKDELHATYFRDADYVIRRMKNVLEPSNILAIAREPGLAFMCTDKRFLFCGYDLIGEDDISIVTNCSGFDKAFNNAVISRVGLLEGYFPGKEVQAKLWLYYPGKHHADCNLWAIWRLDKDAIT